MILLNWKLQLPGHLAILGSSGPWINRQGRGLLCWLRWWIVLSLLDKRESSLLLHNGGTEEYVWTTGDPWRHLLVLSFVVQSLNCVQLFETPWAAAHQASPSFTISQNLLKFMSVESVMLSNHLVLSCFIPLLPSIFPSIRVFSRVDSLHEMAKVLELQLQHQFSSVAHCAQLFSTPWTAAHQACPTIALISHASKSNAQNSSS